MYIDATFSAEGEGGVRALFRGAGRLGCRGGEVETGIGLGFLGLRSGFCAGARAAFHAPSTCITFTTFEEPS